MHKRLKTCERHLFATKGKRWMMSGYRQEGETVQCKCGRKFVHVCDEAEGCYWVPV